MKFSAILFDLDGTLMDSERLWLTAEIEFLQARGKTYDPIRHAATQGVSVTRSMEIIREVYELNDSVSDMVEVIQRRAKVLLKTEAQAKPGAQEILCYVERQAIPCALVSNSTREIVEITIENQPWKHIFHAICPVEVAANPKPAPDLYLYAARQLGVSPSQCLAIEDSPSGAKAAVAAGTTCYVVQESHKHPVFADITPHHFSSLYEVLNLLQENG